MPPSMGALDALRLLQLRDFSEPVPEPLPLPPAPDAEELEVREFFLGLPLFFATAGEGGAVPRDRLNSEGRLRLSIPTP